MIDGRGPISTSEPVRPFTCDAVQSLDYRRSEEDDTCHGNVNLLVVYNISIIYFDYLA